MSDEQGQRHGRVTINLKNERKNEAAASVDDALAHKRRGRGVETFGDEAAEDEGFTELPRRGRGFPPVEHQYKPGNKGGPGRPKGAKNRATLFREEFDKPRMIKVKGRRKSMTATQIGYRQLATKMAEGDLKAIALAEQIRDKLIGSDQEAERIELPLTEAELAILRRRGHEE